MALYDMTDGSLTSVEATSFAAEGVLERTHLQAALRDNISLLGDDLLVVAEEFGNFTDAHRRIDLLCIDKEARPVVVELKRTNDGGHMELQALRYAAMVSAMTFDQLVDIFEKHLGSYETEGSFEARSRLAAWLDDIGGEDAVVRRDVRLILASADFGKEIMTTALWLNGVFGLDIRCVRMTPYRVQGRLFAQRRSNHSTHRSRGTNNETSRPRGRIPRSAKLIKGLHPIRHHYSSRSDTTAQQEEGGARDGAGSSRSWCDTRDDRICPSKPLSWSGWDFGGRGS
jgi:hypothetical protein